MLTRPKQVQQSDSLREQILSLGEEFFAEREAGKTFMDLDVLVWESTSAGAPRAVATP